MDRHTCIIIDRSNGEPLGFSFVSSVADPTVAELLDNIKSGRPTAHNLAPSSVLYALPPEMATRQTSVRNLRRIRADWRQVMEDCTAHYTAERISKIREAGKYSEDQVFMLSYCDVIEPERPIESNLYTVQEENLDCRGRIMPLTRPQAAVVESIRRKIKPPSTSAKNEYLVHTQQATHPEAIYNGRPADLTGPSIAIYHPIFAKFQRGLSQTPLPGDISREDLDSASSFISLSTQYYTTEPERQYAISSVVEALLCPSFVFRQTCFRCGIISFEPDGHRLAKCGLFKRLEHGFSLMLSLIAEVRNGIGLGESDPIEQAEKAYLIVATAPEVWHVLTRGALGLIGQQLEKLRNRSCMPAFFLGISGPYITVSGAIYVDGVITERLTDFISLVPVLSPQAPLGYASAHDKLTYQIAHLFQCLRECLDQLAAEYLKMDPMDIVDERILLPAPHFSSFSNAHHEYKLTYLHRLFPSRSERTVFFAEAETVGQPVIDCIVKFASAYCADAHNIVHEAGAAPRLLYCEFVPSVGKFCVVTEFVPEQEGARLTPAGIQTLQNAVSALHARSYVFGDLRDANILVDGQGNPNLIDFDWSGIEGNVFYPMNINERIGWVTGVQAGGRIMRDHDVAMLRKFRGIRWTFCKEHKKPEAGIWTATLSRFSQVSIQLRAVSQSCVVILWDRYQTLRICTSTHGDAGGRGLYDRGHYLLNQR